MAWWALAPGEVAVSFYSLRCMKVFPSSFALLTPTVTPGTLGYRKVTARLTYQYFIEPSGQLGF